MLLLALEAWFAQCVNYSNGMHLSKGHLKPLRRNKLGTWLLFWMSLKKLAMYWQYMSIGSSILSSWDNTGIPGWPWNQLLQEGKTLKEIQALSIQSRHCPKTVPRTARICHHHINCNICHEQLFTEIVLVREHLLLAHVDVESPYNNDNH